jgi:hypothetical protein
MADTHPNAFRAEAADKRAEGNALLSQADVLDAQAEELEISLGLKEAPKAPEAEKPKRVRKPAAKKPSAKK